MAVRVVPTLAAMAEVYRLSPSGGPSSARFRRYVELGRAGLPVSGYNPMTGQDALGTVEALLAVGAETVARDAAERCAGHLGLTDGPDVELAITVATPGTWTDRLATEVEHRLMGRSPGQVLHWTGEQATAADIAHRSAAETVRIVASRGRPTTAAHVAGVEGLAGALADTVAPDPARPGRRDPAVQDALEVVGVDAAVATTAALLHGDDAARAMGWTPLGIGPDAGYAHTVACAHDALTSCSAATLVDRQWTPLDPVRARRAWAER